MRIVLAGLLAALGVAAGAGNLPVPKDYAQTCRLVGSWCPVEPVAGSIPSELRRPLQLPVLASGPACPVSGGRSFRNSQFGGIALGVAPVQPLAGGSQATRGILLFRRYQGRPGWFGVKTLWFAPPSYQGPVLIRGRRLDGPGRIVMGEGPTLLDPQLAPGPTLNGTGGWREWPGATWLRKPGCYAWQVDGEGFSNVIVFKAVFSR
jgi:hypothetical protein